MSIAMAVMLWLGIITPGEHSQAELESLATSNSAIIEMVETDPVLYMMAVSSSGHSRVIIIPTIEGD